MLTRNEIYYLMKKVEKVCDEITLNNECNNENQSYVDPEKPWVDVLTLVRKLQSMYVDSIYESHVA